MHGPWTLTGPDQEGRTVVVDDENGRGRVQSGRDVGHTSPSKRQLDSGGNSALAVAEGDGGDLRLPRRSAASPCKESGSRAGIAGKDGRAKDVLMQAV